MSKITSINSVATSFDDIKSWYETHLAPNVIDFDDQKPYEVYSEGRFCGIFQCTGQGAQRLFKKAKPKSIVDIAALTSIYRPGPLAAHVDKLWLEHEQSPYDWGHPLINETLKNTRGLLVFQESVMHLVNKVSGFPMAETDEVRRAIMKRSISGGEAAKKKMQELEDKIVAGAVKNGVPEPTARKMYETICFMSGYGFNCAHAVAYSIDSFWCAWLLTYYPDEWVCSYLESMSTTPDKRAKAFGEVKSLGYQIVSIDVNYAKKGWTVLPGKKLMPSMSSCKGVGESAVDEIISMRPIESIERLLWNDDGSWRPSKFNSRALGTLIKVGAFDSLGCVGPDRVFKNYKHMHETLLGSYEETITRRRKGIEETVVVSRDHSTLLKRSTKKDPHEGRRNFFELARCLAETCTEEWTNREKAELYAEAFGTVDVMMMFDQTLFDRLAEKNVRSIEELEVGEKDIVWFVTVVCAAKKGKGVPSAGTMKKTKNGKSYAQPFVTGPSGKPLRLNVWSAKELLPTYKLCFAEVDRNDYGFSTTQWRIKEIA
jgi:DNA polymerase III alpha subunit